MRARWILSKFAPDGTLMVQQEFFYSLEQFDADVQVGSGMAQFLMARGEALAVFREWNTPYEHLKITLECQWLNEEPKPE